MEHRQFAIFSILLRLYAVRREFESVASRDAVLAPKKGFNPSRPAAICLRCPPKALSQPEKMLLQPGLPSCLQPPGWAS